MKSSVHMEKEGLQRAVDNLKRDGCTIDLIVTDRHVQIQKWIRETLPDTKHCFDVWHVAKGMYDHTLTLYPPIFSHRAV